MQKGSKPHSLNNLLYAAAQAVRRIQRGIISWAPGFHLDPQGDYLTCPWFYLLFSLSFTPSVSSGCAPVVACVVAGVCVCEYLYLCVGVYVCVVCVCVCVSVSV